MKRDPAELLLFALIVCINLSLGSRGRKIKANIKLDGAEAALSKTGSGRERGRPEGPGAEGPGTAGRGGEGRGGEGGAPRLPLSAVSRPWPPSAACLRHPEARPSKSGSERSPGACPRLGAALPRRSAERFGAWRWLGVAWLCLHAESRQILTLVVRWGHPVEDGEGESWAGSAQAGVVLLCFKESFVSFVGKRKVWSQLDALSTRRMWGCQSSLKEGHEGNQGAGAPLL